MTRASDLGRIRNRRQVLRALAWLPALPALASGPAHPAGTAWSLRLAAGTPRAELAQLRRLLHRHAALPADTDDGVRARVLAVSADLLGGRFAWNPIGEGPQAWDADSPLRLRRFDCMTYIETVLAVARAHTVEEVFDDLLQLRYGGRSPRFEHRLHFVTDDWLPSALSTGVLHPVWGPGKPEEGSWHAARLDYTPDRRAWFHRLAHSSMYRSTWRAASTGPEHAAVQAWGASLEPGATRSLHYAPSQDLPALLGAARDDHPLHGATALVLRPGTLFGDEAGGGDPVSHVGLLVCRRGEWLMRGTSYTARAVVDRRLTETLRQRGRLPAALGCVVCSTRARPAGGSS